MAVSINKMFKVRGRESDSLKKAQKFFEHDRVWDIKKIRSHVQKYLEEKPSPKKDSYGSDFRIGTLMQIMNSAGFIKVLDNTTWSVSYEPRPERYFMWAHPSGVLVSSKTYQYNPNEPEDFQTVEGTEITSVINVGFSKMGYCGSFGLSQASGGGHMGKSGEAFSARSKRVSSSYEMISELEDIQGAGRIVPFHHQNLAEVSLHTSLQKMLPLEQWDNGFTDLSETKTRQEMYEHLNKNAKEYGRRVWRSVFDNVPQWNNLIPELGTVLAVSMYHNAYNYSHNGRPEAGEQFNRGMAATASEFGVHETPIDRSRNGAHWTGPHTNLDTIINFYTVEEAAKYIGVIQDHLQQRYLPPLDAQLVEQWLHGIKNHHHEDIQWDTLNTHKTTSAGISLVHLCVAQDAANNFDQQNPQSLAIEAIENTPSEVLQAACTTPLADGNTLPLMILEQYLKMSCEYSPHKRVLHNMLYDVFKALDAKVPAHTWNCSDNTNTVDGLWVKQLYALNSFGSTVFPKQTWDALYTPLQQWGCTFASDFTLRLPLRMRPSDDHTTRMQFLAAEKISRPSIEEAFEDIVQDMPASWREKRLHLLLQQIVARSSEQSHTSKRKM